MKKLLVILVVAFLLGIVLPSCKTHEHCPAYKSQIEKTKSEKPS